MKKFKLIYFVPEASLEETKTALFFAGAGKMGDYSETCWQVKGIGQFRPLPGAQPAIGQRGELEKVEEYRVETLVQEDYLHAALKALKEAHPYEEAAIELIELFYP